VADPVEKSEELVDEAARGRSARTPWLALGGVQMIVLALFIVVFAIAFTAYLLA
jgi:hypothetical protein